jgi:putative flippase GtrA
MNRLSLSSMRRDTRRAAVTLRLRARLISASGLRGQSARYALAGAFVALVYLLTTTFLAVVIGLPFKVALVLGFGFQLCVHFALQRTFVWAHEDAFALPASRQAGRYLGVAAAQLGLTALTTSLLPPILGLSAEVIYLMTVGSMTVVNFLLFRNVVFHSERTEVCVEA